MKFYPAYLDLRGRSCLIIGGGSVAERKTLSLLEAGADITIISPLLSPKLTELSTSGKIAYRQKIFENEDISGEFLVIAATGSPEVNIGVARACKERHVLVNVAVPPEESTFIVPSVVERGDLLIAISTSGASPGLSKKVRQELEKIYGPEYGLFLDKLAVIRKRVLNEVTNEQERRRIFQAILDSDAIGLLRQGKDHEAEVRMIEMAGLHHHPK
ncbi:MAG TPA: bifunctional precorrin-2 dehydrogenase/sirohydrochlorin ferrochelatase [Nitrospirota bacterium]|nr:bifunctional precorrin-2 dehydrogenase/sirohydrochlorin ferrochelatase [Nitrospirota bacterium]